MAAPCYAQVNVLCSVVRLQNLRPLLNVVQLRLLTFCSFPISQYPETQEQYAFERPTTFAMVKIGNKYFLDMFPEGGQTRKHCFLAMFPEGGQTRKHCFLAMFPEGGQTKKHCFLAMFPEGGQTRKHCFLAMFPEGG